MIRSLYFDIAFAVFLGVALALVNYYLNLHFAATYEDHFLSSFGNPLVGYSPGFLVGIVGLLFVSYLPPYKQIGFLLVTGLSYVALSFFGLSVFAFLGDFLAKIFSVMWFLKPEDVIFPAAICCYMWVGTIVNVVHLGILGEGKIAQRIFNWWLVYSFAALPIFSPFIVMLVGSGQLSDNQFANIPVLTMEAFWQVGFYLMLVFIKHKAEITPFLLFRNRGTRN